MRALSWDLSPRRPWEDALCEADTWTEAQELKRAFEQGAEDARMERAAMDMPDDAYGQVG